MAHLGYLVVSELYLNVKVFYYGATNTGNTLEILNLELDGLLVVCHSAFAYDSEFVSLKVMPEAVSQAMMSAKAKTGGELLLQLFHHVAIIFGFEGIHDRIGINLADVMMIYKI